MDKKILVTFFVFLFVYLIVGTGYAQQPIQKMPIKQPIPVTPKPIPLHLAQEESHSFNPASTVVVNKGGNWVIVDSTKPNVTIASFPGNQKADADRTLDIIKKYGMNQVCFVRPGVAFQYELANAQAPTGIYPNEVCKDFNPEKLTVSNIQGRWKIVEGSNVVFDFSSNEAQAKLVLNIVKKHGFTHSCSVGKPVSGFQYMVKQVSTQTVGVIPGKAQPGMPATSPEQIKPISTKMVTPSKVIGKTGGPILSKNLPDLKIEMNTTPTPASDRDTVLSVVVTNIGKVLVEGSFVTELYIDGKLRKEWPFPSEAEKKDLAKAGKVPQIAPGGTRLYTYLVKYPSGEKHTFRWIVDAKKQILESDESEESNTLTVTLTWLKVSDLSDLIVEDTYSDKPLIIGEKGIIYVRIRNKGKTDAKGPSSVSPIITSLKEGNLNTHIEAFQLDSLKPGAARTFETKPFVVSKDTEKLVATVDVGNIIPEANEDNNVLTKKLTIYKFGKTTGTHPDFSIDKYSKGLKPTSGTRNVLVILWDPKRPDHPAPKKSDIENLLFGSGKNVPGWFSENSGGKLVVQKAGVLGWYNSDKPPGWYWRLKESEAYKAKMKAAAGVGVAGLAEGEMDEEGFTGGHTRKWWEAIRNASKEFDFTKYNKNNDDVLTTDELTILIAIPQNGPRGFVEPTQGPNGTPLKFQNLRIPLISEWYIGAPPNFGAPIHELCHHFLDAVDMYFDPPIVWPHRAETYSIMDCTYFSSHLDPLHKLKIGWLSYRPVNAKNADSSGVYILKNVEKERQALLLYDSVRGSDEYFIVENRWRGSSYDNGAGGVTGIPMDGMAIWHIVENPKDYNKIQVPNYPNDWGRRAIRLMRANGGNPINDRLALFNRTSGKISSLRWIDGSVTPFALEILSDPGPEIRINVEVKEFPSKVRAKAPPSKP